MNLYARLRWTILTTTCFIRAFWLYSKTGNEQSFYIGFKNPGETRDVGVLTWSFGPDAIAARKMIKNWNREESE